MEMLSPSKLLKNYNHSTIFNKTSKIYKDYANGKLISIKETLIINTNTNTSTNNDFTNVVLKMMKFHQFEQIYNLNTLQIYPSYKNNNKNTLPNPVNDINKLPTYSFQLAKLVKWENDLTINTKRNQLLDYLHNSLSQISDYNIQKSIIKSLLLHRISNNYQIDSIDSLFNQLDILDTDIYYLIVLQYVKNPFKLDKYSRINQLVSLLNNFNNENPNLISKNDWELLESIILNNSLNIKQLNEIELSNYNIFNEIIKLIETVNLQFKNFEIVKMFITFKQYEYGIEIENQNFMKFSILNLRFSMISQAIMEYNPNELTIESWEKYKLFDQWMIIWNLYYKNNKKSPIGGQRIRNKLQSLIEEVNKK
ncbi:hypothetical protein DAPK24_047770 [Pichia kluyveri]|uniref:Uncharacterized protein n=1 Tax=Pichia kluyveri TaxID=36015 RepID=A0AAV5R9L3_PICKL|nr:hypothetical protein DAPK24_047770 [Pichia kluyveri]